jgi:hypothetical protein
VSSFGDLNHRPAATKEKVSVVDVYLPGHVLALHGPDRYDTASTAIDQKDQPHGPDQGRYAERHRHLVCGGGIAVSVSRDSADTSRTTAHLTSSNQPTGPDTAPRAELQRERQCEWGGRVRQRGMEYNSGCDVLGSYAGLPESVAFDCGSGIGERVLSGFIGQISVSCTFADAGQYTVRASVVFHNAVTTATVPLTAVMRGT